MESVADLFNSPFTLNLASTPPYLDIVTKLLLISSWIRVCVDPYKNKIFISWMMIHMMHRLPEVYSSFFFEMELFL